MIESLSSDQKC